MQIPAGMHADEPLREAVERTQGWMLLEFGASWCGHCQAAQPLVRRFLQQHGVAHLRVEDGKGRPLGRSFAVKLWPTLVLLRDGREVARVVRPQGENSLLPLTQELGG